MSLLGKALGGTCHAAGCRSLPATGCVSTPPAASSPARQHCASQREDRTWLAGRKWGSANRSPWRCRACWEWGQQNNWQLLNLQEMVFYFKKSRILSPLITCARHVTSIFIRHGGFWGSFMLPYRCHHPSLHNCSCGSLSFFSEASKLLPKMQNYQFMKTMHAILLNSVYIYWADEVRFC